MRTLYLIFSHDHQEQLARLVRAVRNLSPNSLIAIHHDPAISVLNTDLLSGIDGVHFVPNPVHGEWGDFSLVEQYLHAMRWCETNLEFDWLITITGLTYPIKPLREFEQTLAKSEFDAYVYHFDAFDPSHWPVGTAETRYLFRYFKLPKFAYYYKVPRSIRNILAKLGAWLNASQPLVRIVQMPRGANTRFGMRRVRYPFDHRLKLQGGRQMINLHRRALESIFNFLRVNPWWIEYCRNALIPDECFFTTIVANDPNLQVANNVLRFIKWPTDRPHAASVAVIREEEVPEVLRSPEPFALKLDSRVDARALDLIDESLKLHIS